MKAPSLIAAALLLLPAPALATGGFHCEATDGSGLAISGTIGRVVGSPLVNARLHLGDRILATYDPEPQVAIARAWIDERVIMVDLIDSNAERFEAQLRAWQAPDGEAHGTLIRDDVAHPIRCETE